MSARIPSLMTATGVAARGKSMPTCGIGSVGMLSFPTDPVGATTVTFEGVLAGSELRVYLPSGVEIAGIENCVADQALSWLVYPNGSANNIVRIVIINLAYKILEFSYTSRLGTLSIPVQPQADPWFSNPL